MDIRMHELAWLARKPLPMWGGHLERGEPISDPQMRAWVADGIIQAVENPRPGYVITQKGRKAMDQNRFVKSFNEWTPTGEVVAAADAMRQKRADLIAQPLAHIYIQLARAALDAAAAYRSSGAA